jgi:hypothetical protein
MCWRGLNSILVASLFLSSTGLQGGVQEIESRTNSCQIPNVSESLSRAICAGDAVDLNLYLANIKAGEYESVRVPVREALFEIWTIDRSYGHELSWPRVPNNDVRIAIANFLAQAVRNREIESSLAEYQDLARRLTRNAETLGQQAAAIRLLGVSNSTTDVGSILKLAGEAGNPPAVRFSAVDALGAICSKEASEALKGLNNSESNTSPLRQQIENAIDTRSSLDGSWCRR